MSDYNGTNSVNQGVGTTTIANLFPAVQRVVSLGTVTNHSYTMAAFAQLQP